MRENPDIKTRRSTVAAFFGSALYNQLVAHVPEVQRMGRLRYWQEQHFKRLHSATGISISSHEDFLHLFADATPIPLETGPLTLELFLRDAIRLWYSERQKDVEPEWFLEAWHSQPFFRGRLTWDIVEAVQTRGNFRKVSKLVRFLSGVLEPGDVIELYTQIYRESRRLVSEWRPAFERTFKRCADALPPPPMACVFCECWIDNPAEPCPGCGRLNDIAESTTKTKPRKRKE